MDQPTSRPPLNHSHSCPNIPELVVEREGADDPGQQLELEQPGKDEECDDDDDDPNDSSDTLVDAVLDHRDARDRHVRFQEHVVESAALVERMLSLSGRRSSSSPASRYQKLAQDMDDELADDIDDKLSDKSSCSSTATNKASAIPLATLGGDAGGADGGGGGGGGSVLSSLMRLEAQRRHKEQEYEIRKHQRKAKRQGSGKAPHKLRPKMPHRPASWLSANHLVPSLQKRKLATPSMSRRSSADSMLTTASQFEPITLEDRVRITFEIANILQKQEFLRKLAKSLMLYGCPAHRLEYVMRRVSKTIGVDAEYVYVPNVMFMSVFDPSTHTTETHFIRQVQDFEMHKLGEIYRLERLVSHGEVSVDEALEFVDRVTNQPGLYPKMLNMFVYGLAAFCGCLLFFGGYWFDALIATGLAMILAVYELFTGRIQSFQPIWEITVCILIGFVARALTKYAFCFTPIAFASFIVILPGYTMAVSVVELVSRQVVSGVVRMVYAIVYSFLLGYGVAMGSQLYITIDPSTKNTTSECAHATSLTTCDVQRIDQRFFVLLVPLFAVAYCIYIRARPARWPIMLPVAITGYVVNYLLSCHAGAPSQVLQVVPAFSVGLMGNLLTKLTGKMSFDAVLLGVFFLVPGSLGIKAGFGYFDSGGVNGDSTASYLGNSGGAFALAMIESAIGITIGLFVATLLVYPRGSQRTPLMNF